tara:strand:+ start:2008 stop:2400 length:393 start_codon:yes stop_codon:yes gene_type:complete
MAYEISNYTLKISLEAGADLSAAQYKFVKISSGKAILCAAATDAPIGVLQNSPTSGQEASITVAGGTKLVAGAAIAAGVVIGTSSTGKADAKVAGTDTTEYAVGTVILGSGADAEILTAVINCASPTRAA